MFRFVLCAASCLGLMGFALVPSTSEAGIVYRESINGELSGDNLTPTAIPTLEAGVNIVSGTASFATTSGKPDIFTFTIPTGLVLNNIIMSQLVPTPPSQSIYLALDDLLIGNQPVFRFTKEEINNTNPFPDTTQLLGSSVLSTPGQNILLVLDTPALNNGGRGFDIPLPAGRYTIYLQETGPATAYEMTFNLSAVPEPSSLALAGGAGVVGWWLRRKRQHFSAELRNNSATV